jgi:hemoglobin
MTEGSNVQSPFLLMGDSEELVKRLVARFYARMAQAEPELARTHQVNEDGTVAEPTQARFALFLIEWLGGPPRYTPENGHPRLRMRHANVPIDSAMRDAWLRCMTFAMNEVGVTGEVRDFLDARFADVANFLRNREG